MQTTIEVSFPGGKRVDARVGGFTMATDQPTELGGDGSAPAPFDLFLASIATCAGIYVLGFCQARGLATDGLALVQHHEVDPVQDVEMAVSGVKVTDFEFHGLSLHVSLRGRPR